METLNVGQRSREVLKMKDDTDMMTYRIEYSITIIVLKTSRAV